MGQRAIRVAPLSPATIAATGLVVVGVYVIVFMLLMEHTTYDYWGAPLVLPLLIGITIPVLRRQARREADPRLFWLLMAGLALKLAGGLARYYQVFFLYDKGDARGYHEAGVEIAQRFLHGNFDPGLGSINEEDVIRIITGVIYTVFRPSVLIGFLVFSWLCFMGLFWFYRAFQLAVPEGRTRSYARLMFFLPSLLFWPSSIGKEAWMLCTLGLAAYGAARLLARAGRWRGATCFALGVLGAAAVRPHFAGIMMIALAIGFLFRRPSPGLKQLAPIAKMLMIGVAIGLAIVAIGSAQKFLVDEGLSPGASGLGSVQGITNVLEQTTDRTGSGDSEFSSRGIDSPVGVTMAVATVLFRPFPNEAGNAQALVTAAESSALLLFSLYRWRWILASLRSIRRQPYVASMAAFTFGSILALSSLSNFGILARERVLLLPAYLVLLSIPPRPRPTTARATSEPTRALVGAGAP